MSASVEVDVDAYLRRIGYSGDRTPSLPNLAGLVAAHVRRIPFENLDPLTGTAVERLDAESLQDKLVRRRRGGFCYEHNGLFRHVLDALGYRVDPLAGRVVWMKEPGPLPAETHQLLAVEIPGDPQPYLVDVGFGGQTPTAPLRFTMDEPQNTDLEPFRISAGPDDRFRTMESMVGGRWHPLYLFGPRPRPEIDSVVGSWFASTHPGSHFRTGLSACMIVDDARWNLRGRDLAIHRPDGSGEKRALATTHDVLDLLVDTFGIDISGIAGLEARIGAVLDR
ncbi:arylamine N-acetyltransferase family protein [Gordonia sp. SL306]|uniref:arylamine N-acetyltransferase family protein n=1 Tax=Gordonia sp. SL306 TaxID=2995145 RepID=UPI0022714E49|nr:arylamine N-acetyltransferase [Gordonia sp. SL306]WAC55690.1 arylamine N-acetyltransferase [Gordonia sp. SL306]